jgi:ketosteroid isomerase-like protein
MNDQTWLAERFESERTHLRAVAFRMLGSVSEADDAVQEAWIRLGRSDADDIRRRVRGAPVPDVDIDEQWAVVDAFLAAARAGDFERLVAVLDPDIVSKSDGIAGGPGITTLARGARAVAEQAVGFRRFAETATRVLVNGVPGGIAWRPDGSPFAVLAFTVRNGRIVRIDISVAGETNGPTDDVSGDGEARWPIV